MLPSRVLEACSRVSGRIKSVEQLWRVPRSEGRAIVPSSSSAFRTSLSGTGSSSCSACCRSFSTTTLALSPFPSVLGLRNTSASARAATATFQSRVPSQSPPRAHFHSAPPRMSLGQESCVPCRKGALKLSEEEIQEMLRELQEHSNSSPWQLATRQGGEQPASSIPALEKSFTFKNFRTALAFTNAVGEMAEKEKHHPEILLEWGRVKVAWWTHAIEGLHKNDFICASKTEELASSGKELQKPPR